MRTNWKKCSLFQMEIEFVGHKISEAGMLPQNSKTEQIVELSRHTNSNQLRAFLGLAGYYRKFIQNYSSAVEPLFALLRKSKSFDWSHSCENAFMSIKNALKEAELLVFPDFGKTIRFDYRCI